MSEFLQGLLVCLIGGTFFALLMAPFRNSGQHSAEERFEEDRRYVLSNDETGAPEGMVRHFMERDRG
jgi:hypothetical protein